MKRVIIESPYAGDIDANTAYARRCLMDSLKRGEAPIASHLLYPQVLNENDPEQRVATDVFRQVIGGWEIAIWNDTRQSKADVLAAFDKAIALAGGLP